ncbi:asparagine synthase [Parasitella parasitica]|nr:asparagine synthase [Parasitella parasitica]
MCGFSCYFQFDTSQKSCYLTNDNLKKSLEIIKHRGPDETGTFLSPCGRCALGHVRLSVIGLADGQQPLSSQDGHIHAVVNGELYGYKQIRSELEAKGYRFKTHSDSEVALCLYEEYGISFVDHLRGEFAISIWDSRRKRFFLVRDRFGIKPLYYTRTKDDALLAASEIKAFLPLGWKPEWDIDSLLGNGVLLDNRTAFKEVYHLKPGHYLTATTHQYWSPSYPDKTIRETRNVDEMIRGVRQRLVDAVKDRLIADVPVGVYLSGGIDSSCIAGIMSDLKKNDSTTQSRIKAFSIAFVDDDNFNEGSIAKRTAEFCNTDFQVLELTENDLLEHFEDSVWHVEQHHFNLNSVGKYLLSKMVRDQGYKVVLTGEGSDEHFAGYVHFQADYLSEPDLSSPHGLGSLSKNECEERLKMFSSRKEFAKYTKTDFSYDDNAKHCKLVNNIHLPSLLASSFSLSSDFFSSATVQQNGVSDPAMTVAESLNGINRECAATKWHPLHTSLNANLNSLFASYMLGSLGDRIEMAHSVETRTPFLDHKLCEYVNGLPPSAKVKPNSDGTLTEKWILKEAVKPYVTQEVYERTKAPFIAPPAKAANPKFIDLMNKYITEEHISRLGWISYEKAAAAKTRYIETNDLRTYQDMLIIISYVVISTRFNVATYVPADHQGLFA